MTRQVSQSRVYPQKIYTIFSRFGGAAAPPAPLYLRHCNTFLESHAWTRRNAKNTILATLDVKFLYTNIPHQEGIQYCLEAIENHYKPKTPLPLKHIHQLLKFILENNYFTFNDKFYLQIHRTAIGTPFAPNYANIFMTEIENQILHNAGHYKTSLLWKRFIDDIIIIWPHSEVELLQFLNHINTMHPTIQFEMEYSKNQVHFLDTRADTSHEFIGGRKTKIFRQ